jgi:transcriptional regulator with XRE-family HTH domain
MDIEPNTLSYIGQCTNVLAPLAALSSNTFMDKTDIGETLRKLMALADISENELARQTGVPQPTINRILKGESKDPRTGTLDRLSKFFGITASEMRGEQVLITTEEPRGYYGNKYSSATEEQRKLVDKVADQLLNMPPERAKKYVQALDLLNRANDSDKG